MTAAAATTFWLGFCSLVFTKSRGWNSIVLKVPENDPARKALKTGWYCQQSKPIKTHFDYKSKRRYTMTLAPSTSEIHDSTDNIHSTADYNTYICHNIHDDEIKKTSRSISRPVSSNIF